MKKSEVVYFSELLCENERAMPPFTNTDEELILDYRTGNVEAFSKLISRYLNPLYNFVYRLTHDKILAEDIVQETFVKAWQKIKQYDSDRSSFKTWIFRIARNTLIDYLRKKDHAVFSDFDADDGTNTLTDNLPDTTMHIEETLAGIEDTQTLEKILKKLSHSDREIILLHYHQQLTFEEIGTVLNTSPNTIKSRHRRALIALKKIYRAPK
jgi:RNA polymerase sigma-70 factor (ECF subfamily)